MKGVSAAGLKAMIWAVNVEPILAPMISGTDWRSVIRPAETKPTSSTVVMVEEFNRAVIAAPANTPLNRLEVILASTTGNLAPAMAFRPSVSSCRPKRNRARPAPSSPTICRRFRSRAADMWQLSPASIQGSALAGQRRAYRPKLLLLLAAHARIFQVQFLHRLHDGRRHHEPREPLVVGRHDEPRRILRGGRPDGLLVGVHIGGPVAALARIGHGELPVLLRLIEALEEALLLFPPRQVQEELEDDGSLPAQVFLEVINVAEPLGPDAPGHARSGQPLLIEDVRVHPHDQDLLVIGAIEDTDSTALREAVRVAPEEVMTELLGRRLLEGEDLDALRIDSGHHVFDRAVLAGRVHALEDQQQRPTVLRVEQVLFLGQPFGATLQQLGRLALGQLQAAGVSRIEIPEPEAPAAADAEGPHVLLEALEDVISRHAAGPACCLAGTSIARHCSLAESGSAQTPGASASLGAGARQPRKAGRCGRGLLGGSHQGTDHPPPSACVVPNP